MSQTLRIAALAAVSLAFGLDARAQAHELAEPSGTDARRAGGGWLSTEANDFNLSTSADGALLVFGRSTRGDFADARIFLSRRGREGWTTPQRVVLAGPDGTRDSDPWLTPDGRWLYFVSDRPAPARAPGREDLDLWRAPVVDGRIGTPQHLAGASSTGEELGPEVHDGWLSFNSTRTGGPAPMSLYRARVDGDGAAAAEPMPAPFNAGRVQGDLTFSPDGALALFWSIRDGSTEPDLFAVRRAGAGWNDAVRLPAPFNAPGMDFTPAFGAEGAWIAWASQRTADGTAPEQAASADIHVATRAALDAAIAAATTERGSEDAAPPRAR